MINLLREKRMKMGITQLQLAKRLKFSQAIVSKIETCERRLDVIELMDFCAAMNVTFTDFIDEYNAKIQ